MQGQINLQSWMEEVRAGVDRSLERFFEEKLTEASELSTHAQELVSEVRGLTMRGGKRVRPIVTAVAFRAASGSDDPSATIDPGAALELLQTYLLIHDDWMDADDERRGGPAVHFAFARRHNDTHLGASLGVLAGDLASTFGWELLLRSAFPAGRRDEALRLYVRIQKEVFAGQQLDLMADQDVERMHRLKTGSYTTRGPAELGGLLADATEDAIVSLRHWAEPVGVAFQLRDDLLGTFGSAKQTGKPGEDLRHGKNTAVVAAFRANGASGAAKAAVDAAWGNLEATDAEVEAAQQALFEASRRVETRLDVLVEHAVEAVAGSPFDDEAKAMLDAVTRLLTDRGA